MSLEQTYELIKARIPKTQQIDSLDVVKQVEEYRQFWKPARTRANVFLLGESHVSTKDEELASECNRVVLDSFIQNYPTHYVRFVYCLGYGEPQILNKQLKSNRGRTSQFWKIFSSCIAESCADLGFQRILAGRTVLYQRLGNKVSILQEMQRRGIWLLDASIVGINRLKRKKSMSQEERKKIMSQEVDKAIMRQEVIEKIITTCWDEYIKSEIVESQPKHIIVIGKGVARILRWRLELLKASSGTTHLVLPQPQGNRVNSEQQLETYREYQRTCSKYACSSSFKSHC